MEEALTAWLMADAPLAELVGNRIAWDLRPQAGALPAVSLSVAGGAPLADDHGALDLNDMRVQIDCWAVDADGESGSTQAKRVARRVKAALGAVAMTFGGVEFQGVFLDNTIDFTEEGKAGVTYYRRMLDFNLWHKE